MAKELRLLLLEDDDVLSMVVSQMLEHLGFTVVATEKGEDTVNAYARAMGSNPFDGVILDLINDGGMGGAETAEEIFGLDPDAHIIISSGFGSDPLMTNYSDYGFKNVLKKPYMIDELSMVLKPFLTESTQGV